MTTSNPTSHPTSAHRPNAPTAYSAEGMQPARVAPRRGSETKAAFKTTEFIVYVVAVIGVLVASFLVIEARHATVFQTFAGGAAVEDIITAEAEALSPDDYPVE